MSLNPRSHTLFHFTDSLETLVKIIETGFWPRYCAEDFRWYNEGLGYVSYPIVSFCDIPLTRIGEHTSFYGRYGLGVSREWAINAGLNPVIYLSPKSELRKTILRLAQPEHFVTPPNRSIYTDNLFEVLALIKPLSGRMPRVDGTEFEKDFCLENEWRYTPKLPQGRKCIPIQKHRQEKDEYDRYTFDKCLLKFDLSDISYVILETEAEYDRLFDYLGHLEKSDDSKKSTFESLRSRVISLEKIARDF